MMGSRYLFLRLPTTSTSTTTTLASTWGRRILTEKSAGSLIFFARSPFNARLEENKNKGKRGNTITTRLLTESRRYYCLTTISPPRSDDPKLKSAGNEYRSESEIAKLCKENKALEAFKLFQKEPTLVGAKHLFHFYRFEGGLDSVKDILQVYDFLVQQRVLPDREIFSKLMLVCNINAHFSTTLELYHDMEKYHVSVDSSSFPEITVAVLKQGDKTVAKKLLDVLKSGVEYTPYSIYLGFLLFVLEDFDDAVWIFDYMLKNNIEFNKNCFIEFLKVCSKKGPSSFEFGQKVYSELSKSEFMDDGLVLNHLLQMYVKCGDVNQSIKVFEAIKHPNEILFHLIIDLCAYNNYPQKAIEFYEKMNHNNITPTEATFVTIVLAISNLGPTAIEKARQIHKQIIQLKLDTNIRIINLLIQMYAKCGEPYESVEVYDQMIGNNITPDEITFSHILTAISNLGPIAIKLGEYIHQHITQQKFDSNVILLNSLIQIYDKCGEPNKSVEVYDKMIENNITRDEITFINILKAISNIGPKALEKGRQIHQQITQQKFDSNVVLLNSLIRMYDKCGEPNKSVEIYDEMIENNITPTEITFNNLLRAIARIGPDALEKGRQIHQQITQHKFDSNIHLINSLIRMYDKCGEPNKSLELHTDLASRVDITQEPPNETTLASVLSACAHLGEILETFTEKIQILNSLRKTYSVFCETREKADVIEKFRQLQKSPQYLLALELHDKALQRGKEIHQQFTKLNLDLSHNTLLTTSLMRMYTQCGEYDEAQKLFNQLENKSAAFHYILITYSYIGPTALYKGKHIHGQIIQKIAHPDMFLLSSLLQMYRKCGEPEKSIELYDEILNEVNYVPSQYIYSQVLASLSKIGNSAALEKGKLIHQQIIASGLDTIPFVFNTLLEMYSKCGEPQKALSLYNQMTSAHTKDIFTYRFALDSCLNVGTNAHKKGELIYKDLLNSPIFR